MVSAAVALGFDLFLGEVGEWAACAGHKLQRSINDDSAPPGVLECGGGHRPEYIEVFRDPVKVVLALSLRPVWYVASLKCHRSVKRKQLDEPH
jgi:hypothetical protein